MRSRKVAAKRKNVLHGTNLELIVLPCRVCHKSVAIRVDPDDVRAHIEGLYIQDACPYLAPEFRELFITATCPDCWRVLCVDPIKYPTAYN